MKTDASSSHVDERDQWRARIQRALEELRSDHERIAPRSGSDPDLRAESAAR